jgi:arylamine N-acetyltransferase
MATKYTLWIHVTVNRHNHLEYTMDLCSKEFKYGHIHEMHKVDLCVNTNHEYSIATWTRMDDPGSSFPSSLSMNLTMKLQVLKSNMVETT